MMRNGRGATCSQVRAFTLIELLVVISVIALLIGIVLPSLGGARQTARRAKCMANLRSIGQGFAMYLKDSKDRFPLVRPLHSGQAGGGNEPSLLDIMGEYLDAEVPRREDPNDPNSPFIVSDPFKCPSDLAGAGGNEGEPMWREAGTSYEYLPGLYMFIGEMMRVRDPAFGVTKAYEKDRNWPLVADAGDFHKIRARGVPRNAVFFPDYRADWMPEISAQEAGKFIEDMVRYGG